jgi:hypothetical protein
MQIGSTYSGMLEGYPITPINDGILDRVPGEARDALGPWPVHVIDPPRTLRHLDPPQALGPEERLPACCMTVSFDSSPINDASHASCAIVVWFQNEAFPFPADSAMLRLRNLPWERFAEDFEY